MAKSNQREQENGASSNATMQPKSRKSKKRAPRKSPRKPLPPWKVLLHNDDVNAIDYVVQTIIMLTPLRLLQAMQCTNEAHKTGVALLLTTHKERAELYRDQFQSKRLTVTIEPAEE